MNSSWWNVSTTGLPEAVFVLRLLYYTTMPWLGHLFEMKLGILKNSYWNREGAPKLTRKIHYVYIVYKV